MGLFCMVKAWSSYLRRSKRKRVAEEGRGHEEIMILIGFLLLSESHIYLP